MVAVECQVAGCGFAKPNSGTAAAAQLTLLHHVAAEHPQIMSVTGAARDSRKPPPLERPTVELGCSPAQFKIGSKIPTAQQASQAMECFSKELGDTADKSIFDLNSLGVDELLQEVKAIAVQPVATGLRRAEAHSARQLQGEWFQAFAARTRGLMVNCQYVLPCPHARANEDVCSVRGCRGVDYSSEVVRDVLAVSTTKTSKGMS